MGVYYLVVDEERLLGLYRDARRAAALAARFARATVLPIPRDADPETVRRVVGDRPRIVRHVLGKLAMVVFRDPRAFGVTDWAWERMRGHRGRKLEG